MLMLLIFAAGAMGGAINALLSDNGFLMPKWEKVGSSKIFRLGFLGNIFISGIGACISWGLYGPLATANVVGAPAQEIGMTLSTFAGAILVGIAGARWVTNEVDKLMLRAIASEAAKNPPSEDMAATLALAKPAECLEIIQKPAKALKVLNKRKAKSSSNVPTPADEFATMLN